MVGDRFHLLDMLRGYDAERIGDLDADDTRLATRPALDPRGRSESLVRGADEGAVLARLRADVRSSRRAVLAAAGALAAPWPLRAQEAWPARPVRYINPYTAGGPTDTLSRQLCQKMAELSGQQFVVENRTGSGGIVGNLAIAPSPPDGYTLGLGGIATHAIAPTLYARLPFDPQRDFTFTSGMWQLAEVSRMAMSFSLRCSPITVATSHPVSTTMPAPGSRITSTSNSALNALIAAMSLATS